MKLKKKQQQFIKEAYRSSDVCQGWKDKIKENFPKLFTETELEVGKWYKNAFYNTLLCYTGESYGYGFFEGKWNSDGDWGSLSTFKSNTVEATKEEVEQALIIEAKKRGFKEGVKIKSLFHHDNPTIEIFNERGYEFVSSQNKLYIHGGKQSLMPVVFYQGEWAEIIETITKAEAEKELGKVIID